ncbi:MAG: Gfo/Idh/MocA family oxidoreductase [Verrucomicrobia bacterium]|nr:Gfo/Idh/MocA family oxidoreductase [Verrucomicrobiota bacterium]
MINVGIVGLGFMAATHVKAYRKLSNARIAAICNPSGRHLDGDLSRAGGNIGADDSVRLDMSQVKAFASYESMLADPVIDLVDICAPTVAHVALAITALKAGKHVICEKPLARTVEQARQIVEAAKRAKGFFMPAMCLRFWPQWTFLKRAIDEGSHGKILGARFRRVAEPPGWGQKSFLDGQNSGGALFDLHVHDTDFVQFCFGRPRAVFSTGFTKVSGAIDHVVTQYQFASGASVHAEGSWAMTPGFGFNMAYTAVFERATVDYDLARGAEALRLFEQGQAARTIHCEGDDGYVGELRHLIEAIQTGRPPSVVTPQDGLSSVEICAAEEKSVREGRLVEL